VPEVAQGTGIGLRMRLLEAHGSRREDRIEVVPEAEPAHDIGKFRTMVGEDRLAPAVSANSV
jgi:hypothetical protein